MTCSDFWPKPPNANPTLPTLDSDLLPINQVNDVDSRGESALMMVESDVEVVKMLLAKGNQPADVNLKDEVGRSVLMRCMKRQVFFFFSITLKSGVE